MATPRITLRMPVAPIVPANASQDLKDYASNVNRYLLSLQQELDRFTLRVDQLIKVAETLP